mmetsp:Transcript_26563/g.69878  ORF Transcript_26563/g.69878 Transcript_26563/m.69878 type:complete len:160 (+) Transcript_26563:447-926(+)
MVLERAISADRRPCMWTTFKKLMPFSISQRRDTPLCGASCLATHGAASRLRQRTLRSLMAETNPDAHRMDAVLAMLQCRRVLQLLNPMATEIAPLVTKSQVLPHDLMALERMLYTHTAHALGSRHTAPMTVPIGYVTHEAPHEEATPTPHIIILNDTFF